MEMFLNMSSSSPDWTNGTREIERVWLLVYQPSLINFSLEVSTEWRFDLNWWFFLTLIWSILGACLHLKGSWPMVRASWYSYHGKRVGATKRVDCCADNVYSDSTYLAASISRESCCHCLSNSIQVRKKKNFLYFFLVQELMIAIRRRQSWEMISSHALATGAQSSLLTTSVALSRTFSHPPLTGLLI